MAENNYFCGSGIVELADARAAAGEPLRENNE